MTHPEKKCFDCDHHCHDGGQSEYGDCRKRAPTVVVVGEKVGDATSMRMSTEFPRTHIYKWCGEFKPKYVIPGIAPEEGEDNEG